MKTLFCRVVLVCLAILLIAGASYSQTQINGAATGNWSSTSSWSPATVPNNSGPNTFNVTLLSSPAVNITLDISPTIDTLTLDAGSVLTTDSGFTLTTTGITNAGNIEFYNGNTLTVNGSMTNALGGFFDLDRGSKLIVTGNLTNGGEFFTNNQNGTTSANTITVTGTFTNNAGGNTQIGLFGDTSDVMNVGMLANSGLLIIDAGATLNLTNQPNGLTDVVSGSDLEVYGTFKAGTANGLAKLNSVEGILVIGNGQTFTDTPGSGTLTNSGTLDLEEGSNMTVSGNLTNSGTLETNIRNQETSGHPNTLTVTGTFTNNSGATTHVGFFGDSTDVMNVGTLVNNGLLTIDNGATLNLTNQPNGVTDVVGGSELDVYGTLKAGTANGLAKLNSVEGTLVIGNGQTFTDTPGSGTLTNSGILDLEEQSSMTVSGNLTNSGIVESNGRNQQSIGHTTNTLTVTGTFTNNSGATTNVGNFTDTTDVMNFGTLVNNGRVNIDIGATLNLTNQPNGITDVVGGSELDVYGTVKAGTANGLAKLNSVEGVLVLGGGQTLTDTPGSGTLTNSGILDLEEQSSMTVSGNLTNSGIVESNGRNQQSIGHTTNTLTVTGTFTNNSGATTNVGNFTDTTDVMNFGKLVNNGRVNIDIGATLNLTNQPTGITDVVAGSELDVYGTFKAGTANALATLNSVEGTLVLGGGQTLADTPGSGTLTNSGVLDLEEGSSMTVSGALTNSGTLETNARNQGSGKTNTLTVTTTFTNNTGATTIVGDFGNTTDVMNVGTLVNNGVLFVESGATLNLTNQPNGITTVASGSQIQDFGTIKAGTANAFANLGAIQGFLLLGNGQTTTVTPGSGTLTISGTNSQLDLESGSTLIVDGNLTNSGLLVTNHQNRQGGTNNITVTGTFNNALNANADLGFFGDSTALMTVGTLTNAGSLSIGNTDTLVVANAGTVNNTGTINVGDSTGAGTLKISGNTLLTGTNGKVVLSNFAGNVIEGAASTDVLTVAKGQTIEGSGNIGNNSMGLNNQGTIQANQSTPLIIQISSGSTNTNSGTLEATNGATAGSTLQLDAGTYTQTSTGNILATETGNDLSAVNLESGVIINGGKLTTTGTTATINLVGTSATLTLNGVSISGNGSVQLADGSTTTLLGTITNTGTIDLNSTGDTTTLSIGAASVTLSGTGKIILASNGKGVITGPSSSDVLHNGNTIEGPGNIGNGIIGIVNTGTILENSATLLTIDAGSMGFNNQGTVTVDTNDTLYINNLANQFLNFNSGTNTLAGGTYIVDGTLKFDGANIVTNNASITLSGSKSAIENGSSANALTNFATNNGSFALASGRNFTTIGNFTNNGTLNIGGGTKFAVGTNGAADLTNYASDTLTGGTYLVTGTLQFNNVGTTMGIVTNDASITLSGAAAKIEDQNGTNMLTNLATNGSGSTFALASSAKFNTVGNFTNNGTLNVATGTKFSVGTNGASNLTNYASDTLTGGSYIATGTGQIQFNNEGTTNGIVTNAANITLSGSTATASFIDQNGANMLAKFATNSSTGSFTLISSRTFTTAAGFSNAGMVEISKTTTLTIGANGNYTQTGGSTTVDGTLTLGSPGAVNISGGNLFGNGGTINGAVNLTAGNVNPGDGLGLVGDIKVNGNYTQGSSGDLNIDIAGTAPNTLYSVLNIVDAASLSGTLNVNLENGFVPKVNTKFTIVDYKSDTGQFVTTNFPTVSGDHWTITYNATNIVIELVAGPGAAVVVDNLASDSTSAAATSGTATTGAVHGSPATRVSRSATLLSSTSNTHGPVAILSRVTCFAARLLGSASCGRSAAAVLSRGNELHVVTSAGSGLGTVHNNVAPNNVAHNNVMAASTRPAAGAAHNNVAPATARPRSGAVHNNVMIASRSIAPARGGSSNEPSISAATMARFYVCAYLPTSVGRTMGCN
jgi:hypothetical protein